MSTNLQRRAWLVCLWLGFIALGPAQAQAPSSIVGTWTTTLYAHGQAWASISIQFQPDGRYQKRTMVRQGIVNIIGSYRFDPQQSTITYRAEASTPTGIDPGEPIGQWLTIRAQFLDPRLMVIEEPTGPVRWVKQN